MTPEPADAQARDRAVLESEQNLVVVAGAGTGKTSLLVERWLYQLLTRDLEIDQVAAITFTERAAGELRGRLAAALDRLGELADDPTPVLDRGREADRVFARVIEELGRQKIGQRSSALAAALPMAPVHTIHGFCARLLRSEPLACGLSPDFSVDDGAGIEILRDELWDRWLEREHAADAPRAALWDRVHARLDLSELRALAFSLCDFALPATAESPELSPARSALQPVLSPLLSRIAESLEGQAVERGPGSYLSAAKRALGILAEQGVRAYREALQASLYLDGRGQEQTLAERKQSPSSKKSPNLAELAKQVQRLLRQLDSVDDAALSDALEGVTRFAEQVHAEELSRGMLSFHLLLRHTRDVLARDASLRRRIADRTRMLLVDEFQDTDPLQYEIVFYLCESRSAPAARDPFETRLEPGKLFIVGDPKQAIYRFRGADMAAYRRAVDHVLGQNGVELELVQSFRPLPALLAPLNRLFPRLLRPRLPEEREIEPGYREMVSGRSPIEGEPEGQPRVELWSVLEPGSDPEESQNAEAARQLEAAAIGDWIASRVREGLPAGDIAILLRATTNLEIYSDALRSRRIPFETGGGDRQPLERTDARRLWALLRALHDPDDAPALIGVLRSPLGAVTDRDLALYAATRPPNARASWSYLDLEPDPKRFGALARAVKWLRDWHARADQLPLPDLLCALLDETPWLALEASAPRGLQRALSLRHRVDQLCAAHGAHPTLSTPELLEAVERARSPEPGGAGAAGDAVQILSVHGAKGLEFPVVILPDLGRAPGGGGRSRGAPTSGVARVGDPPGLAARAGALLSSGWIAHQREDERHQAAEEKRVFYVACTRARDRLLLVNARRSRGSGAWLEYLESWDLDASGREDAPLEAEPAVLHRRVMPASPIELTPQSSSPTDWQAAVARERAAIQAARDRAQVSPMTATGLREQAEAELDAEEGAEAATLPPEARASRSPGRAIGEVLHDLLERWDRESPASARALLSPLCDRTAARLGLDAEKLRAEASGVLEHFLESDLARRLSAADLVGRELPLVFEDDEGRVWTGRIDLLYRDSEGRLVIADYKADSRTGPDSDAKHRPQLDVYRRGVARAFPKEPPPRAEIWYLRSGRRAEI